MAFFDFASNISETSEIHQNKDLKTHYYKARYNNIKKIVLDFAKEKKMSVRSEDDIHGEIFLQSNRNHMIISIMQISPLETAVDVKVQTYKMIGLYKPMKDTITLFNYISKKADFKGTGLHP